MGKNEVWKPIPIHPWHGLYEVSSLGRVRHAPRLVSTIVRNGYNTVSFGYNNRKVTVGIHRLVAAAFGRSPVEGEVVHHKNNNKRDNRIENLEWTSRADNSRFPKHPTAKIDPNIAFDMRRQGYSHREIGERFGVTQSATSAFFARAIKSGRFVPEIAEDLCRGNYTRPPPNGWSMYKDGRSVCKTCWRPVNNAPRGCTQQKHRNQYDRIRQEQERVRAIKRGVPRYALKS